MTVYGLYDFECRLAIVPKKFNKKLHEVYYYDWAQAILLYGLNAGTQNCII